MKQSSIPRTAMLLIATLTAFLLHGNQAAATTAEAESKYPGVVDTSNCTISTGPRWIHDDRDNGVVGSNRKQYFGGQRVHFPFTINYDVIVPRNEDRTVSVSLYVGRHLNTTDVQATDISPVGTVNLSPGDNHVDFTWDIPAGAACGFYDVKAVVNAGGKVLETTEPGMNNITREATDPKADDVWIGDDLKYDSTGTCAGKLGPITGELTRPSIDSLLSESLMVCRDRPVVLIHGINGDPTGFGQLENIFAYRDFFACRSFNYGEMTNERNDRFGILDITKEFAGTDVGAATAWSSPEVRDFYARNEIDVISHSMGGLVALACKNGLADGGTCGIRYVVTIDSPLLGFNWVAELAESPYREVIRSVIYLISEICRQRGEYDLATTLLEFADYAALFNDHQIDDIRWGSQFQWQLHTQSQKHDPEVLALGSSDVEHEFVRKIGDFLPFGVLGDVVVPNYSACGLDLVGTAIMLPQPRVAGDSIYAHIPISGFKGVCNVTWADVDQHIFYHAASTFLVNSGTIGGYDIPGIAFSRHPIMVKVEDQFGHPVSGVSLTCRDGSNEGAGTRLVEASIGSGIYAGAALTSSYLLEVLPKGIPTQTVTSDLRWVIHPREGELLIPDDDGDPAVISAIRLGAALYTNGNGMPDWVGTIFPKAAADGADGDTDRDGLKNRMEIILGLNPEDPNSQLETVYTVAGAPVQQAVPTRSPHIPNNGRSAIQSSIKISTAPGVIYKLQRSLTLKADAWSNTGAQFTGHGYDHVFTDTVTSDRTFYRITVEIPDLGSVHPA